MKLKEVFDQLTYGELSQLSIGGQAQGEITEENYARVVAHVNLGLSAIYKRFHLLEGAVRIQLIPGLVRYRLSTDFLITNTKSKMPVRYLVEEGGEFTDTVLKVKAVLSETGVPLLLNQYGDSMSVTTPELTTLVIPDAIVEKAEYLPSCYQTETLLVKYQADHPRITIPLGYFDPSRVEMHLPYSHLEPLLYFVAARMHTPVGMEQEGAAGNNWFMKYEAACQRLEQENIQVDQGGSTDRFTRGGWV